MMMFCSMWSGNPLDLKAALQFRYSKVLNHLMFVKGHISLLAKSTLVKQSCIKTINGFNS